MDSLRPGHPEDRDKRAFGVATLYSTETHAWISISGPMGMLADLADLSHFYESTQIHGSVETMQRSNRCQE